jgi:hypothetical protein
MNSEEAEFIGWYYGDGCLSSTKKYMEFALTGDATEERSFYQNVIIPYIQSAFRNRLKLHPELKIYSSVGVCGFYTFDRAFVKYLVRKYHLKVGKKLSASLPKWILCGTPNIKLAFVRGIFDTDGSIFFCRSNVKNVSILRKFHYKPKIKLATISGTLMRQIYLILLELGFKPLWGTPSKQRSYENAMYSITIHRISDIKKWLNEVGFRSEKHCTKLQVWKQFGFCPPKTSIKTRKRILQNKKLSRNFYSFSDDDFKAIKAYVNSLFFCET